MSKFFVEVQAIDGSDQWWRNEIGFENRRTASDYANRLSGRYTPDRIRIVDENGLRTESWDGEPEPVSRLDEIEARPAAAAATPGPWEHVDALTAALRGEW